MGEPRGEGVIHMPPHMTPDELRGLPPDGHWVFHKGTLPDGTRISCPVSWRSGPFTTEADASTFITQKLVDGNSCPGCGGGTPNGNHYTVVQVP